MSVGVGWMQMDYVLFRLSIWKLVLCWKSQRTSLKTNIVFIFDLNVIFQTSKGVESGKFHLKWIFSLAMHNKQDIPHNGCGELWH